MFSQSFRSRFSCRPRRRFLAAWLAAIVLSASATTFAAEHVIHISVDGLNAAMVQQLIDQGKAPNLQRLKDEGAWTFNARADYTQTNTLPNHTSILTGRPVAQPEGMPANVHHGWTENRGGQRGSTLHKDGNPEVDYIASVFDVVHDAGLSTALYASKPKFAIFDQSYDENNGAPHEHGRDKIDVFLTQGDEPPRFSQTLNRRFLDDMAQRHFNYAFLHYRDPDTVGHALSWGSGGWFYAVRNADAYLGEVLKLVDSDPKLAGRTVVILTTDHGGVGFGHSDETKPEDYTVPVFVWGAGVGRGELYAFNRDTRADPGAERIDFAAKDQPIRNGDTGNLALRLLGLGPIPGSLINAKQDLQVAIPGDYNLDGSVDASDSVLWTKLKGSNDPRADGNHDGKVDEADQELLKVNFGRSAAAQP